MGIVKRTQSEVQALGAYFVPTARLFAELPEVAGAGPGPDPVELAGQLWGNLFYAAADVLLESKGARSSLSRQLRMDGVLHGDDVYQARQLAAELFRLDLESLADLMPSLARVLRDPAQAGELFELIATCTDFRGSPWIAADVAAELSAQVELAARTDPAQGRLLDLRSDATFDLSYQHLTAQQARLFRLLPVNPGPDIATAAAAGLAGLAEHEAAGLLADLHRAHLIAEPASERWGMHDLIRLYATDQHTDDEQTDLGLARHRLFGYYRDTARAAATHIDPTVAADTSAFTDRAHALAWLDAEHTNVFAVVTTDPGHHLADTDTDLAFALAEFLYFRRQLTDLITIATRARDHYQQAGDLHREAGAWLNLCAALGEARRFDEAIDAGTRARDLFEQADDRRGEAAAWDNLGLALRQVRRFDEAIDAHTRARGVFEQAGDRRGEAAAWDKLGLTLGEVRRFGEAIDAHTRARDLFEQAGDRHSEATAWNNLGLALRQVRRFGEAIDAHTRAQDLFEQAGDRHGEAAAGDNLGIVLAGVRRFGEAIDAHARARDLFEQAGDRHSEAMAWNNLGLALRQVRRFDEAIDAHTRAQDLFEQAGDRHSEAMAWNNLGLALAEVRRFDEARTSYRRALATFIEVGDTASAEIVRGGLAAPSHRRRWFHFR